MTSRLKRKLNDIGVDTTSSKANENFCLIGTPLPPLEKSKDTGEFVPLWKQEVRDEKGRRRLHGAFTGGFSAGYFNTVGSKEGWTPSTFTSSRNERAKKREARPEDFMDDEDLAELRESQKLVDEHEEMDFGATASERHKRMAAPEEQDPIATALAASLAPPPKDSVGARILQRMGWRFGQGIGPRLTYAQRKAQDAGFLDPSREVEGDEDDLEEAKKHTYPRKDIPVLVAPSRKDTFHGLGYVAGLSLNESIGATGESGPSGPQLSAGFGLGALNDADDDDVDIYDGSHGPSSRRRVAFDDSLEDDRHISIGPSRQAKQGSRAPDRFQAFNDGTPVLKGFLLSDKPVSEDRWFPLPEIPPNWKPNPQKIWEEGNNKENQPAVRDTAKSAPPTFRSHAEWKASQLSADERGSMLGETPLPAKSRSVFDYLSKKDRERLQAVRATTEESPGTSSPRPPSPPRAQAAGGVHVPHIHPSIAKAALSGFQPFTADPVKQSRYTAFLTFQANGSESASELGFGSFPGQSVDDFNKELADYAQSATVFKPLSGAMAGRFRSAVIIDTISSVEGLHQPTPADADTDTDAGGDGKQKEEDPKMGAVRLGMYGQLTRETVPWQPAKLLCKRFGVKEPEVDTTEQAGAATAGFEFATGAATRTAAGPGTSSSVAVPAMITAGEGGGDGVGVAAPKKVVLAEEDEGDAQGKDILTYERPAMDVFKAIFASDDEDSDEDEGGAGPLVVVPAFDLFAPAPPKVEPPKAGPPAAPPASSRSDGPVDLATFKPTFVPRVERDSRKEKGSDKREKKRDREKKKAKAALMSFEVEDDGSAPSFGPQVSKEKDRERRKKRRKERREEDVDDDESMWVEKPAPAIVGSLPFAEVGSPETVVVADDDREEGPPRGRKRAIDFM